QYNHQSTMSGVATRTRVTRNLAYRATGLYTETQTGGTTLQSTVLTEDLKGRITARNYTPNTLGVEDSYFRYDDQDRLLCETTTSVGSCPSTGAGIKNSHTASPPFTNSGVWKENRFSNGSTAYIRSFNAGISLSNHRIRKVGENTSGFTTMQYYYTAKGERYYEVDDPVTTAYRGYIYDQRSNRQGTIGYYRSGGTWYSYSSTSAFDAQNRRVYKSIQLNDVTSTWFYYYDADSRLTEVRYTPNTTSPSTFQVFQLLWLRDRVTAMYQADAPSGAVSRRYVVGDETHRPLELWAWPTSGDMTRMWAINPSAYGFDVIALGSSVYQPLLFEGQQVDAETTAYRNDGTTVHRPALVHNGFRTYDPMIGGYLQTDPLSPATWSSYMYADGNPVEETDPSGLMKKLVCTNGSAELDDLLGYPGEHIVVNSTHCHWEDNGGQGPGGDGPGPRPPGSPRPPGGGGAVTNRAPKWPYGETPGQRKGESCWFLNRVMNDYFMRCNNSYSTTSPVCYCRPNMSLLGQPPNETFEPTPIPLLNNVTNAQCGEYGAARGLECTSRECAKYRETREERDRRFDCRVRCDINDEYCKDYDDLLPVAE
ncbi:MAG: RHS repeat-associated core domain-containing protein, partial [Kofleriaceae bacterium]